MREPEAPQSAPDNQQLLSVEREVFEQTMADIETSDSMTPEMLNALRELLVEKTQGTASEFLNALRTERSDEGA